MNEVVSHKRIADQLSWWYQNPRKHRQSKIEQLHGASSQWLERCFGYYSAEISMLNFKQDWFPMPNIQHKFCFGNAKPTMMTDFESLPLASESVDAINMIHVLEFVHNPHQLLREIDRVLIPEGKVLILSFNPLGWQGIQKVFWMNRDLAPWCGHFYSLWRIKDWLSVLGFDVEMIYHSFSSCLYKNKMVQQTIPILQQAPLFCSLSMFCARKRVSSMTPIEPHWEKPSFANNNIIQPTTRGTSNV